MELVLEPHRSRALLVTPDQVWVYDTANAAQTAELALPARAQSAAVRSPQNELWVIPPEAGSPLEVFRRNVTWVPDRARVSV